MSGGRFLEAWQAFMDAYERNDSSTMLDAFRARQGAWEEAFWADDFSEFGGVYLPDVELHDHMGFLGTVDVYRGLDGFRGWRRELTDVAASAVLEFEEIRPRGRRFAALGTGRGRWRFTNLPVKISAGGVWTLEGRRIARVDIYRGRRRVLRALAEGGDD